MASAANWFIRGRVMCYRVYVIMILKDPQLAVVRVGHVVLSVHIEPVCAEKGY